MSSCLCVCVSVQGSDLHVSFFFPSTDGDIPIATGSCVNWPHDIFNASSLAKEGINHWRPLWDERGLAEEAEQRQHAVEGLKVGISLCAEGDPLAKLCEDDQVQDDWTSQQRVLGTETENLSDFEMPL